MSDANILGTLVAQIDELEVRIKALEQRCGIGAPTPVFSQPESWQGAEVRLTGQEAAILISAAQILLDIDSSGQPTGRYDAAVALRARDIRDLNLEAMRHRLWPGR
jgi:hypothetical protein